MRIRRSDEEVEIHRGANHVCVAAGRLRDAGSRCVPAARGQRSHVLHLEEEVRQPGCERAAPAQAVARRECTLEAPGGRSDPGSAHSAGGAQKKDLRPARRRQLALWIHEQFQMSKKRSCRLALLQRATFYYRSRAKDQSVLRMRIRELAHSRPRFGYERIHILLRREGWLVGRNRVHRLYRLEGLQVRMRVRRRKRISLHRGPVPAATTRNEYWSMDFVHDQLANGRVFRVLTVIDKWSRESVLLETSFSLTGQSVVDALQQMSLNRPLPKAITVDHGTEFTSKSLDEWAWNNGVKLDFIRPGKPTENAFIESFNGRLRDECLNVNEFVSIEDARQRIEIWRQDYNQHRPHSSLGHLTPNEFAMQGQETALETAKL